MKNLIKRIANAKKTRQKFPEPIKKFGRFFLPREEYSRQIWIAEDPYSDCPFESEYPGKFDVKFGIIREFTHMHKHYIAACRKLGVPYKLIDISGPDWLDNIRKSGCDAFLVWPSAYITIWKHMYDERLKIITEELGKTIYPSYDEIWFYESKRRMDYWMDANNIPQPGTWVFYEREKAVNFAEQVELPVVYKSDFGSGSSGVRIFRRRKPLIKFVNKCFRKGVVRRGGHPRDRQWGSILLQQYMPNSREWRMIRIGDSYFGYEKVKVGDFASGSHAWNYERPSDELLNLLKNITDKGGFRSMDLDVLITPDGEMLVSELQTVFGMGNPWEMCVINGKPGRMIYKEDSQKWEFEEGKFCENFMCDLRVQDIVNILSNRNF
jgi:hypothetical protein